MNLVCKINGDESILASLDGLMQHGYLTEDEVEYCLMINCVSSELVELISKRIEIYQNPKSKCKSDQVRILREIQMLRLLN